MFERIKKLCAEKGITIAELERSCQIGNGIIARWKKSKPSYDRVAKVAHFLGVTPEYLLTGENKEPAPIPGGGLEEKEAALLEAFSRLPPPMQEAFLKKVREDAEFYGVHPEDA